MARETRSSKKASSRVGAKGTRRPSHSPTPPPAKKPRRSHSNAISTPASVVDHRKRATKAATPRRRAPTILSSGDEAETGVNTREVVKKTNPTESEDEDFLAASDHDDATTPRPSDDDDDLSTMDPKALKKALISEAVTFSHQKNHRSQHSSSATSDEDKEDDDNLKARLVKARSMNKRELARKAEVPRFATPTPDRGRKPRDKSALTPVLVPTDDEDDDDDDEDSDGEDGEECDGDELPKNVNKAWPKEAHYVPPAPGCRNISIKSQATSLKAVIREGINTVISDALFVNTFPSVDDDYKYYRKILRSTARRLAYSSIADRIQMDVDFGVVLSRILHQRLSNMRGNFKKEAARKVEAHYQLIGTPAEIAEKVQRLLINTTYAFATTNAGLIIRTKPFMHPCVLAVLRQCIFTGTRGTLADRYHQRFGEVLKPLEPGAPSTRKSSFAIPNAMLCMVATAVHSALDDWKTGQSKPTDFNTDVYHDVYDAHATFLDHIRQGREEAYDKLMSDIFTESIKGTTPTAVTLSSDAIQLLDLAGMAV